MESKNIVIKKTAQHIDGGKYLDRAAEGPIPAPVFFQENKGKVEATIDGEAIGYVVGMTPEEIPAKYEAKVVGVGEKPNTFEAELNVLKDASKNPDEIDFSDFEDEIKFAVSESGLKQAEVEERVKVMLDNSVKPSVIKATLSDYHKVTNPHIPSALFKNTREQAQNSILNQSLMAAHNGQALIYSGEKSTGKNVCAETVAYCRGESFTRLNFQKNMLLEDIFGSMTFESNTENLTVENALAKVRVDTFPDRVNPSDLEQAAQFEIDKAKAASINLVHATTDIIRWAKEGGIMLYDEVNMANANILQMVMNSVADSEKVLIVPSVGTIKLNKHCTLLAGMNPGYAGTMELNTATKSRCGFVNFEFPKTITPQLKTNFEEGEVPENFYQACEVLYGSFKTSVESGNISSDCLNIRGFVNALRNISCFPDATNLRDELNTYVVSGCDQEERDVVETILYSKVRI